LKGAFFFFAFFFLRPTGKKEKTLIRGIGMTRRAFMERNAAERAIDSRKLRVTGFSRVEKIPLWDWAVARTSPKADYDSA